MGMPEENRNESKRGRPRGKRTRSASLTVKMPPETLERIEKAVADVQAMAKGRVPDKADVLLWMLTGVDEGHMRKKIDAWNQLFE
jgi:hypothetical protein